MRRMVRHPILRGNRKYSGSSLVHARVVRDVERLDRTILLGSSAAESAYQRAGPRHCGGSQGNDETHEATCFSPESNPPLDAQGESKSDCTTRWFPCKKRNWTSFSIVRSVTTVLSSWAVTTRRVSPEATLEGSLNKTSESENPKVASRFKTRDWHRVSFPCSKLSSPGRVKAVKHGSGGTSRREGERGNKRQVNENSSEKAHPTPG